MAKDDPLLVPVQLEAFVLNPEVCGTGKDDDTGARIVPITQPNYTFLRLDNFLVQSDVLSHVDVHSTAPADLNPRMYDLGQQPPVQRRNRYGVYLHWILPRVYRAGVASDSTASKERHQQERLKKGLPAQDPDDPPEPSQTPEYGRPPVRWMVIRKLDMTTIVPQEASSKFQEYSAWIIESDYRWTNLDAIPQDFDLQVDVSPFVVGAPGSDVHIDQQAEVFIGRKTPLDQWPPAPRDGEKNTADISLLNSGNQLFADYQLHNTNVFSMLDNFQYIEDGDTQYLDHAQASYYLVGWHSEATDDPMWNPEDTETSHEERLRAIFMQLIDSKIPSVTQTWLDAPNPTRIICHGAMYDVKWDVQWDEKHKAPEIPANKYADRLKDQKLPAISVGTTPLDSLITYCTARHNKGGDTETIKQLEEDILAIDALLHTRDDGVEGQREAKDTIYNWNFSRAQGGAHYFIGGEDSAGKPTQPDIGSIKVLKELNELQILADGCRRALTQYRWDMFSCWWKYVSDVSNKGEPNQQYQTDTDRIAGLISKVDEYVTDLQKKIDKRLPPPKRSKKATSTESSPTASETVKPLDTAKSGTLPFFYRARDPTVLIGGIDAGWPLDFLENTQVRLPEQVITTIAALPDGLKTISDQVQSLLPTGLSAALGKLLSEFCNLNPETPAADAPQGQKAPQYHDTKTRDESWRDRWGDKQPFFPLYFEWEAEYTHIPFDLWKLDEMSARLSDNKLVRYGIKVDSGKPLWEELGDPKTHDTRILSGRSLILPQPSFSLKAKVTQLFRDTPPSILEDYLKEKYRTELLLGLDKLSYLSSPLDGMIDGLVTLKQGAHIKPENRYRDKEGEHLAAVGAAQFENAGFTEVKINAIQGNSGLTPYAASSAIDDSYCPFKPVSHGQFRFRKLNVIDKFGQALVVVNQDPRPDGPPALYPCISDFFEPQLVEGTKTANTVIEDHKGQCEYMQIPPQICQNSRLNASFVVRTAKDPADPDLSPNPAYWRPATEWENPIWGWIVVNYADYGIQLFLPNGTFYRELRIGGPNETLESPKWTPFSPDPTDLQADTAQLDALLAQLKDVVYVKAFWNMLTSALDGLPPAPNSYAEFLNCMVGKPLALVNMGWSLELDGPPFTNLARSKEQDPERWLLKQDNTKKPHYTFQVKFGDKEREYDGLVGYFATKTKKTKEPQSGQPQPLSSGKPGDGKPGNDKPDDDKPGEEFDLAKLFTYFLPPVKEATPTTPAPPTPATKPPTPSPLVGLNTTNYPKFEPYWIDPAPGLNTLPPLTPPKYTAERNKRLQVYSTIVDPFTSIHASSSFLPTTTLALPSWTWQEAMNTMTAFFHAGPFTLTNDVQDYKADRRLTTKNMKDPPPPGTTVALPSLGAGEWSWLQPYVVEADVPAYNSYDIEAKGNIMTPGFQKGPYVAVEGFLQLRQPIMQEKEKVK